MLNWKVDGDFKDCQTQIASPDGDVVQTSVDVKCVSMAAASRWGAVMLRNKTEEDDAWGERIYRKVIGIGDTLIPEQNNSTWLDECQDDPIFDAGMQARR